MHTRIVLQGCGRSRDAGLFQQDAFVYHAWFALVFMRLSDVVIVAIVSRLVVQCHYMVSYGSVVTFCLTLPPINMEPDRGSRLKEKSKPGPPPERQVPC